MTGWGKDAFISGSNPSILREVDVPVLSQENCQTALRNTRLGGSFVLDSSFMCAGGEAGKDACTVREYILSLDYELYSNPDHEVILIWSH